MSNSDGLFDPFERYESWRKHALGEMLDLLYCLQETEMTSALEFVNRLQAVAKEMKQLYAINEMTAWLQSKDSDAAIEVVTESDNYPIYGFFNRNGGGRDE